VFLGDRKNSIAKKGGHVTCFWKAIDKGFPKKMPQANLLWRLNTFGCHSRIFFGCHKVGWLKILVTIRFSDRKVLVIIHCGNWKLFWSPQGTTIEFFVVAIKFTVIESGPISIAQKLALGSSKVLLT
jgi:hypothetical protein